MFHNEKGFFFGSKKNSNKKPELQLPDASSKRYRNNCEHWRHLSRALIYLAVSWIVHITFDNNCTVVIHVHPTPDHRIRRRIQRAVATKDVIGFTNVSGPRELTVQFRGVCGNNKVTAMINYMKFIADKMLCCCCNATCKWLWAPVQGHGTQKLYFRCPQLNSRPY